MRLPLIVRNVAADSPWWPYVESTLIVCATMAVNVTLYPHLPGYYGLPFNPYLLGVMIVGGRYGILPALFTATISIGCYFGTLLHAMAGQASLYFLTPWHYAAPVAMLITALLVGGFASRIKAILGTAVDTYDQLDEQFERLSHLHMLLGDEKHLLDKQILSEEKSLETMIRLFVPLERLSPQRVLERIVLLMPKILGGGEPALYKVRQIKENRPVSTEEGPRYLLELVNGKKPLWPETLGGEDPVVDGALRRDGSADISQQAGWMEPGRIQPDSIQLACKVPHLTGRTGYCLLVKNLPFAAFAPARLGAVSAAMQVAGKALRRARIFRRLHDRNIEDEKTQAASLAYFRKRLSETHSLAQRYKTPFSIITIHMGSSVVRGTTKDRMAFRRAFALALVDTLRLGDLVAYSRRQLSFHILLPFTAAEPSIIVRDRLQNKMVTTLTKHGRDDLKAELVFSTTSTDGVAVPLDDFLKVIASPTGVAAPQGKTA